MAEQTQLINALTDTLRTQKLNDSTQQATISALRLSSVKDFLDIKTKDTQIVRLQGLVDQYKNKLIAGGSATLITSTTDINTNGQSDVKPKDTVYKDNYVYIYPEYTSHLTDGKWYTADITANRDTSTLRLSIVNDYDVVIGADKGQWFADVINHNKYSTTTAVRTYSVSGPPIKTSRWGVSGQVGYGGVIVNGRIYRSVYLGAGVSYTFIRF